MKIISLIVSLFITLLSSLSFASEEPNNAQIKARFQTALTAYDTHQYGMPDTEIKEIAKELFESGSHYYKKDDANFGLLAYYYAKAMNYNSLTLDSIPLLEQSISIYRKAEELPKPLLIDSLLELAKVKYKLVDKKSKSKGYFTEALTLAKQTKDQIKIANTQLEIGKTYLSYRFLDKRTAKEARKKIESAYNIYLKAGAPKQIEAAFWAGKVNRLLKQRKTAAEYFEITIKKASENKSEQQYSEVSHAFLVDVYSKLGEEDKATEHCKAIGKNQIWNENVEPKPLYIKQPKYPRKAALKGKGGYVTMEFVIDPNGFTKDLTVIKDSNEKYGFAEAASKVMSEWRFAPKYENGIPVDATVRYTMQFKIQK